MSGAGARRAAELLKRHASMVLRPSGATRLDRALAVLAQDRAEPVDATVLAMEREPALLQALVDEITVQETWFFRDGSQFDLLGKRSLPSLPDPITVWSAGCANGQEAYSLAMALDSAGRKGFRVLATDVSLSALERTRAGRYRTSELRGLTTEYRDRYFRRAGDEWEIDPDLRNTVETAHLNLVTDPFPTPPGSCPVVFCRNVLIYFTAEQVRSVLFRLSTWLPAGGWLFLGLAETPWGHSTAFETVRLNDAYAYRAAPPGAVAPPPPVRPRPAARAVTPIRRRRPAPAPDAAGPVAPLPSTEDLLRAGEAAVVNGDLTSAIDSFRRAAYLDPDMVVAHLNLALSFEAIGDARGAARAHRAARAALERRCAGPGLDGYTPQSLRNFIDQRLERLA